MFNMLDNMLLAFSVRREARKLCFRSFQTFRMLGLLRVDSI